MQKAYFLLCLPENKHSCKQTEKEITHWTTQEQKRRNQIPAPNKHTLSLIYDRVKSLICDRVNGFRAAPYPSRTLHLSTHSLPRLTFRQETQSRASGPQQPSEEQSGSQTWPAASEQTVRYRVSYKRWTRRQQGVMYNTHTHTQAQAAHKMGLQ